MAKTNSTACAAALTKKQITRTVDKLAALKAQITNLEAETGSRSDLLKLQGAGVYFGNMPNQDIVAIMNKRHTAIHESGHTIAHFRLGIEQLRATIVPNEANGTLGGVCADNRTETREEAENQVIAFCCGLAALVALGHPESIASLGWDSDFDSATAIIEAWQLQPINHWKEEALRLMSEPTNLKAISLVSEELIRLNTISVNYVEVLVGHADGEVSEAELLKYRSIDRYWQ